MAQYPSVLELADLDGTNGFTIRGEAAHDYSGISVASAGDVNGDGLADMLVGAPDGHDGRAGAAYVVFGKASGFGGHLNLSTLDGENGFKMSGVAHRDETGWSVDTAGDVNGDGIDDVLISAYASSVNGNYSGGAYIVFGTTTGFDADIDLGALDGDDGFLIKGAAPYDSVGETVSAAGDVNGDGFADVVLGARYAGTGGKAFVLFGAATFGATVALSALDGDNGFSIKGASSESLGSDVSSADVNGDGNADLILGARDADAPGVDSGAAYVVFGKDSGWLSSFSLASLDGNNGFKVRGEIAGDALGESVSSAGDFNADGIEDFLLGADGADASGDYSGACYVVFGKASGWFSTFQPVVLDGSNGFQIDAEAAGDDLGYRVTPAGDYNGDGFDDVMVTAVDADPNGASSGAVYVLFGGAFWPEGTVDLADLDGNNGFQLNGEHALDHVGRGLAGAGDINGDGFDDLMVGTSYTSPHGTKSGTTYVVYGAMPGKAVTRAGTDIANTIHGGDFNDTLSGVDGDDTLIGHGGNDRLNGGNGADTLLGGSGDDRLSGGARKDALDGGSGHDRFVYGGASDSTSTGYDIVQGANFKADVWDLSGPVTKIDATIETGNLAKNHFDQRLAMEVDADHLKAHHAVLFTPDSGHLKGNVFLVVDLSGTAGYQFGADLVMQLVDAQHLGNLGVEDFV